VSDGSDNCPANPNPSQADRDGDGLGNACDPLRINFQPCASPVPSGYEKECGAAFSEGAGRGWTAALPSRDRNVASDQRLDTFVFTSTQQTFEILLPNADYSATVVIGDAGTWQGPQRVLVEGISFFENVTTSAGQHLSASHRVKVRDGHLSLAAGGLAGYTAVNYLEVIEEEIQPASVISVNFQPCGSVLPSGWRRTPSAA